MNEYKKWIMVIMALFGTENAKEERSILKKFSPDSADPNSWLQSSKFVFLLSFLYVVAGSLYSTGFPNYLLFELDYSVKFVGILSSISALAYIVGPLLLHKLFQRIQFTRKLLIALVAFIVAIQVALFWALPPILFLSQFIDGLVGTYFWISIERFLARAQYHAPPSQKDKIFRNFGISWNLGAIFGDLAGLILISLGVTNRFVLWTANGVLLITLVVLAKNWQVSAEKLPSLTIEGSPAPSIPQQKTQVQISTSPSKNTEVRLKKDRPLPEDDGDSSCSLNQIRPETTSHGQQSLIPESGLSNSWILALFPLVFLLVGEFFFQFYKGTVNYGFYLVADSTFENSFLVYLVIFCQQIGQTLIIWLAGKISALKKLLMFLGMFFAAGISIVLTLLIGNRFAIIFAAIAVGIFGGGLYAFPAQLLLYHSSRQSKIPLASFYEIFSALGYGVAPLIAGVLFQDNLNAIWLGLLGFFFFFGIYFAFIARKALRQTGKQQRALSMDGVASKIETNL